MSCLLLVEDDERLGQQVIEGLRRAGYETQWIRRGDEARSADFSGFALVILDLMLPGAHGYDLLKALRADRHEMPVLVLSARQEATAKVRALELGADDYLTKPFWPEELVARVRARLRRPRLSDESHAIGVGALLFDLRARRVTVDGQPIDLTPLEFDLVGALAQRAGAAVSRLWLAEHLLSPAGDDRGLDAHISRIRRKLGRAGGQIRTVWGLGYRMEGDT